MLSITPGIKVMSDFTGSQPEYFSFGDNVEIETYSQKRLTGVFLYMALSQDSNVSDNLIIDVFNEHFPVPVDDIKSILKLPNPSSC